MTFDRTPAGRGLRHGGRRQGTDCTWVQMPPGLKAPSERRAGASVLVAVIQNASVAARDEQKRWRR